MDPACSKLGVGLCGTGHYVSRQAERRLTVLGRRLSARSTPALTEHRKNAMLIAPTATEIRTFISRPSVPHSSIFPATRQGQAADAVTALAVAHRRRPPSLEILCVPPLRAFTEKIEHCLENLLFSCPVQKSILSTTPLLKDANVGDFLHINLTYYSNSGVFGAPDDPCAILDPACEATESLIAMCGSAAAALGKSSPVPTVAK